MLQTVRSSGAEGGQAGSLRISVRGLVKSYGKRADNAVKGISFNAPEGQITSLLGPSGCGKTTTLRCIAGLESIDQGEILFGDTVVSRAREIVVPAAKRDLGMVFQSYALWPHLSLQDNISFGLKARGWTRARIASRVKEILHLIGLSGMEERYPAQLSGGQQQRVALGRALAYNPKVLLMDEPLANLDANLREQMRFEIRRLQQQTGVTMLYVTHDRMEATSLSDVMIVMNRGDIMQLGAPAALYDAPANSFVARFMGHSNFIPISRFDFSDKEKVQIETPLGACMVAAGDELSGEREFALLVQPEAIRLISTSKKPPEGDLLSCIGQVLALEKDKGGLHCRVEITGTSFEVPVRDGESVPASGDIRVTVDPARCIVVPLA